MAITVLKNNAPWGPFTRIQVEDGLKRGDFTLHYLAHSPGLREWLPLGEVLHFVDLNAGLPPVPGTSNLPPVPDAPPIPARQPSSPDVPPPGPAPIAITPVPDPLKLPAPPIAPTIKKTEVELKTASFFRRFIAFIFDCSILFAPIIFLYALGSVTMGIEDWWKQTDLETKRQQHILLIQHFHQLLLLVAVGLGWLYGAGLESSRSQATFGKKWMGIKVTDMQGERLSFLRASGRLWAKYLSVLTLLLGFIMALFSSRGLTLHDRLAGTRVIRK